MKRVSRNLQGFKGRQRSFAVQVVRLGSAEPPKRRGETKAPVSQPPQPAPLGEAFNPELEANKAPRPWQAAGARIIEAVDQPRVLDTPREPKPRCGRPSRQKLDARNGKQVEAEAVTAGAAIPAKLKNPRAPHKHAGEEIRPGLAEPALAPAASESTAESTKAKRMRRSKIEALVARLAEPSTPSRAKREVRKVLTETGVRLTFRQRRALRLKASP